MRYLLVFAALLIASPLAAQQALTFTSTDGRDAATGRELQRLVSASIPFAPPDQYATWWERVTNLCSCTPHVALTDIQWRLMADGQLHDRGAYWAGVEVIFFVPPDHRDQKVVMHEMLHAVLGGDPNHTNKAWRKLR